MKLINFSYLFLAASLFITGCQIPNSGELEIGDAFGNETQTRGYGAKISALPTSDGTIADTDDLLINDYSESRTESIDASQLKTYFQTGLDASVLDLTDDYTWTGASDFSGSTVTLPATVSGGLTSFEAAGAAATVQSDVDTNESDADAAIALKANTADTYTQTAADAAIATSISNLLSGDPVFAGNVGFDDTPEFSAGLEATLLEFSGGSDATITRSAAGVIAVEGVDVLTTSTGYTQTAADAAFEVAGAAATVQSDVDTNESDADAAIALKANIADTYTQTAADAAITASPTLIGSTIFVAKTGTDTRTDLDPHDIRKPFLTVNAAQAVAVSGDTIMVFAGDYSGETALGGVDGVYYQGMDGATLPAFNVVTGITIYGSGLAQSLICNHASAVMNFARMDAVTYISCGDGEQTAGNAGISIDCYGGVQTAGNAGTFIQCEDGEQTAGNAVTYIECYGGVQTAGNAGTYIYCEAGVQTAGNAGTYIYCEGGEQTAGNAGTYIECEGGVQTITHANFTSTDRPIRLSGSGNLTITGRIESTESNGVIVSISNNWSGTLNAVDLDLTATTVATNGATIGIQYGTSVTGSVQLKNCTIITAKNGSGTAKSIDAPSAQTVYVQGSLNQTHAVDADITLTGGATYTNTNYTV